MLTFYYGVLGPFSLLIKTVMCLLSLFEGSKTQIVVVKQEQVRGRRGRKMEWYPFRPGL